MEWTRCGPATAWPPVLWALTSDSSACSEVGPASWGLASWAPLPDVCSLGVLDPGGAPGAWESESLGECWWRWWGGQFKMLIPRLQPKPEESTFLGVGQKHFFPLPFKILKYTCVYNAEEEWKGNDT